MLAFPDLAAPAALGVSGIWIGSQLEMSGTNSLRHNTRILVQTMLQLKETEKALYAFVSDIGAWLKVGKMRRI